MLTSGRRSPAMYLLTLLMTLWAKEPLQAQSVQTTPAAAAIRWAQEKPASSDSEAAAMAVRQHGGQVLRVERRDNDYKVRLLMPDGRVKHVTIPGASGRG